MTSVHHHTASRSSLAPSDAQSSVLDSAATSTEVIIGQPQLQKASRPGLLSTVKRRLSKDFHSLWPADDKPRLNIPPATLRSRAVHHPTRGPLPSDYARSPNQLQTQRVSAHKHDMFRPQRKSRTGVEVENKLYGSLRDVRSLSRIEDPIKRRSRSLEVQIVVPEDVLRAHAHNASGSVSAEPMSSTPEASTSSTPSQSHSKPATRSPSRPLSSATTATDRTTTAPHTTHPVAPVAPGHERAPPADARATPRRKQSILARALQSLRKSSFSPSPRAPRTSLGPDAFPRRRRTEEHPRGAPTATASSSARPRTPARAIEHMSEANHTPLETPPRGRKLHFASKLDFWLHPRFGSPSPSRRASSRPQSPLMQLVSMPTALVRSNGATVPSTPEPMPATLPPHPLMASTVTLDSDDNLPNAISDPGPSRAPRPNVIAASPPTSSPMRVPNANTPPGTVPLSPTRAGGGRRTLVPAPAPPQAEGDMDLKAAKRERRRSPLARLAPPRLFRRDSTDGAAHARTKVSSPLRPSHRDASVPVIVPPPVPVPPLAGAGEPERTQHKPPTHKKGSSGGALAASSTTGGIGPNPPQTPPAQAGTVRNARHGSFDFERPTSSGGERTTPPEKGAARVRFADGHKGEGKGRQDSDSGVSGMSVSDGSARGGHGHGHGTPHRRRGSGSSSGRDRPLPTPIDATLARSQSARRAEMSAARGTAGASGSWGRTTGRVGGTHGPGPAPAGTMLTSHGLPQFSFEPVVAKSSPSPSGGFFPASTSSTSTGRPGVSEFGEFAGGTRNVVRRGKGRSLDLGLGLTWAPKTVREEAVIFANGGQRGTRSKWAADARMSEVLREDALAEAQGAVQGREEVMRTLREVLGEAAFSTLRRYLRRYEAGAIPFDGPSGLLAHVDRILESAPGMNERRKRELLADFARVAVLC